MNKYFKSENHEDSSQNKNYKVYLPSLKQWIEVTKEQYYAYYRDIWATRKRAQAHGQCMCPKSKMWLCDGDCALCSFHAAGDEWSLDYEMEVCGDKRPDLLNDMDEIIDDQILLKKLFKMLERLDPESRRICDLIRQGKSERDSALEFGVSRTTYRYRKNKLLAALKEKLEHLR